MNISQNPLLKKKKSDTHVMPTIENNSRKEESEVLTWEVRESLYPGLH